MLTPPQIPLILRNFRHFSAHLFSFHPHSTRRKNISFHRWTTAP